ncbi:MAG: glycosyltransferase family 2 protein [Gemmatimonadota bacterium]
MRLPMPEQPLVSVVTPSFNQAPFLEETMRSVLDQDYPRIEYIVVDGGSTDGSVDIIRRYADRLAYWVSEKDRGQADAINKGWSRVTGDIVAFLNSDDYYLPGAIPRVVEAFRQRPDAGVVYGQAQWVSETGVPEQVSRVYVDGQEMLDTFPGLPQPATFVRRAVLEKVGLLDPSFHFALDGEFFVRAVGNFPAVPLPDVLACMRLHGAAKSVSAGLGFAPEVLRIAEKVIADPARYPRYRVVPDDVRAGAHVVSAKFTYMGGHFREALGHLRKSAALSPKYRGQILRHELPRLLVRGLLGKDAYARTSAGFRRSATPPVERQG